MQALAWFSAGGSGAALNRNHSRLQFKSNVLKALKDANARFLFETQGHIF